MNFVVSLLVMVILHATGAEQGKELSLFLGIFVLNEMVAMILGGVIALIIAAIGKKKFILLFWRWTWYALIFTSIAMLAIVTAYAQHSLNVN